MSESALRLMGRMPPPEAVRNARLPEIYQGAKLALTECTQKDECMDWANRAEALASYARQAGDEELRKMADRIQARAIRRCGELLREIEKASNQHDAARRASIGAATRTQAATDAGMSKRQAVTAIRVSNIPADEFERDVEGEDPPTVTTLAERGKQSRLKPIVDLEGIDPGAYSAATSLMGALDWFMRETEGIDLDIALSGVKKHEWAEVESNAESCIDWLECLLETMRRGNVRKVGTKKGD